MSVFIDRRLTDRNKSQSSKKKYYDRIDGELKDAVKKHIGGATVKDLLSSKSKNVTVVGKGLSKPQFVYKRGGISDSVHPGNKDFDKGDRFRRPDESGGGGGNGGPGGDGEDGEDPFSFPLTKEEFWHYAFHDLELPDMVKKKLAEVKEDAPQRAGFSPDGAPNRLNIVRSLKQAYGRRFALSALFEDEIKEWERKIVGWEVQLNKSAIDSVSYVEALNEIDICAKKIEELREKIKCIPLFDDIDLRYNRWEIKPKPITQAVVFCVLDVSGSMGEWEKDIAKRFFLFELLFLQGNYERIKIEWIIHTTEAHRVEEEEFFTSRKNGGTVVSSALDKVRQIVKDEYPPSDWNIFVSQISDGGNASSDNGRVLSLLEGDILPITQYYTYVEINRDAVAVATGPTLFAACAALESKYKNFTRSIIDDPAKIWPVFRKLFEKKS
jgi:uncharacterized sporulation protein YeaH/YhbH (DUF444 family)